SSHTISLRPVYPGGYLVDDAGNPGVTSRCRQRLAAPGDMPVGRTWHPRLIRMASLSDPKVREFLSFGTRTAKVAFTAGDGRPVVTPVWFLLDGDEIVFNTGKNTAK